MEIIPQWMDCHPTILSAFLPPTLPTVRQFQQPKRCCRDTSPASQGISDRCPRNTGSSLGGDKPAVGKRFWMIGATNWSQGSREIHLDWRNRRLERTPPCWTSSNLSEGVAVAAPFWGWFGSPTDLLANPMARESGFSGNLIWNFDKRPWSCRPESNKN